MVMGIQLSKLWVDCVRIHKFCIAKLVYSNTKVLHWLIIFILPSVWCEIFHMGGGRK